MFVKKRAPRARKATRKVKTSKKAMTKVVKRVLQSQVEEKEYSTYGANQTITTASASQPTFISCMPSITQGTSQGGRIGQEIKIKYARVKGYVNLLPYNVTTNPLSTAVMLKLWLCSSKLTNLNGLSNTACSTGFFETGAGTAGFQGNLLDMLLPNNKDEWTIFATKQFELGTTYASGTGPVGTGGYFDNSKMIIPFNFRFEKHFKGPIKFNDNASSLNGNYPYNRNLYLIFQAVYADGSSAAVSVAEFHHSLNIKYTDM